MNQWAGEVRYWLVACKTCADSMGWDETPLVFLTEEHRDWWHREHLKAYPDHETRTYVQDDEANHG